MRPIGEFKCPKCGWVHAGLLEADVEAHVAEVNADALRTGNHQWLTNTDNYRKCFRCGEPSANFVAANPDDAPLGCTLQAVIAPTSTSA